MSEYGIKKSNTEESAGTRINKTRFYYLAESFSFIPLIEEMQRDI